MRHLCQLIMGPAKNPFEGIVHALDGQVGIQDQDPIRSRVEQSIEALLLVRDLPIETRVEDRDRRLVRKGLQQHTVVGSKQVLVIAKDEDHPDHLVHELRGAGLCR